MSESWGPWIEHDGKGCPCVGSWVQCEYACGWMEEGIALERIYWRYVTRYRIRKPKGLSILQDILREVEDDGGMGYNERREMEDVK